MAETVRTHLRPGSNSNGNMVAFHPTGGGAKGLSVGELAPGIGFGNGGQVAIANTLGRSYGDRGVDLEATHVLADDDGDDGVGRRFLDFVCQIEGGVLLLGVEGVRRVAELEGLNLGAVFADHEFHLNLLSDTLNQTEVTRDADACQADTRTLLRQLREAVGTQAFEEWGARVAAALRAPEVLRPLLHGGEVQPSEGPEPQGRLGGVAQDRQAGLPNWIMCALRDAERLGRTPQGSRLAEQLARELGADLSKLPQPGAQAACFLLGVWEAGEGLGLLRQALSTIQEMGRPAVAEAQPAHASGVRRLTPREAERLQGLPDDWTRLDAKTPDSRRYSGLGDAVTANVAEWLGRRIIEWEGVAI